jgi:hypothetical protein
MAMTEEKKADLIRALLRERDMLTATGKLDKIAGVNAELNRLGAKASPPAQRATRRSPRRSEE